MTATTDAVVLGAQMSGPAEATTSGPWQEETTYDYDANASGCEVPVLAGSARARVGLYCAFFVAGVAGNLALLAALWARWRRRGWGRQRGWRPSETLAANLAAADLLFLTALPFWIDSELSGGTWRAGELSCKGAPFLVALSMNVGVLMLTFVSVDRYLAVVNPSLYRRLSRALFTGLGCLSVWLVSPLLALPVLRARVLQGVELEDGTEAMWCQEEDGSSSPGQSLLLLLFSFFLPLLLVLLCYCRITRTLCLHARRSSSLDTHLCRSFKIIFLVVGAFVLSWVPFNTFRLVGVVQQLLARDSSPSCVAHKVAQLGMEITAPLAFANSCANPFIYALADRSLRRDSARCLCPCLVKAPVSWGAISFSSQQGASWSGWRTRDRAAGEPVGLTTLQD
ncbi:G-protein coupled receptor 15 [Lepisosteus oculatus]|uniref:G-protein coupled receptor 15 n=1 Tax=Lepisosteus oculatus TaxID=7918 RepID=UPI0037168485